MTISESIISGIVQGVTEFLPISSSGHLVLLHNFFGLSKTDLFFDVCLHFATLAAVCVYFRKDLKKILTENNMRYIACITTGTMPVVLSAFFLEKAIAFVYTDPVIVMFCLIFTGAVLFAGQLSMSFIKRKKKDIGIWNSAFIGISQILTLFPGISRSGLTISSGLAAGVKAEEAFRFSFLLSIPVIFGAMIFKAVNLDPAMIRAIEPVQFILGMVMAFAVGLLSLPLLRAVIMGRKLYIFGIYCILLGIVGKIYLY